MKSQRCHQECVAITFSMIATLLECPRSPHSLSAFSMSRRDHQMRFQCTSYAARLSRRWCRPHILNYKPWSPQASPWSPLPCASSWKPPNPAPPPCNLVTIHIVSQMFSFISKYNSLTGIHNFFAFFKHFWQWIIEVNSGLLKIFVVGGKFTR